MTRRKLKVGIVVYSVYFDEEYGIDLSEHRLRTIRKNKQGILTAYFIKYVKGITWVKKSKKHGDWGWADNIEHWYRDSIMLNVYEKNGLPHHMSFTKSGAFKKAIQKCEGYIKDMKNDKDGYWDDGDLESEMKMLTRLKSQYTQWKRKGQ